MSRIETHSKLKIEQGDISKDFLTFYYLSFKYSQGVPSQQYDIFRWVGAQNEYDLKIDKIPTEILYGTVLPKMHTSKYSLDDFVENQENAWRVMFGHFKNKSGSSQEWVSAITLGMIKQDLWFMKFKRQGRPYMIATKTDSKEDVHASFIRKYVLNQTRSGHRLFDRLFLEMGDQLRDGFFKEKLNELSILWESTHKGYKFFQEVTR